MCFLKYAVVGETGESPTDEQKEDVADPSEKVSDEGDSNKKDDDISNEDPSDEDPDTEEPSEDDVEDPAEEEPVEEEVKDPAIDPDQMTIMAAGDEYSVTDGTTSKTGYTTSITAGAKVTEGNDYTFTVKPDATYQIDAVNAKVGEADAEKLTATATAEDGTETYKVENVTGNVVITVEVSKIKYTVEAEYNDAAVTLTYGTGVTGTETKEIEAGSDLTFTAEPKAGSTITGVTYTMGTAVTEPTALTVDPDNANTYKIPEVSGNVKIMIASETTYKVTFVSNANVTGLTDIKIDGKDATPDTTLDISENDGEVSVKEGSTLSFKVTPAEFFMVSGVKDGADKPVSKDKDGVYSLTVNAATTLTVATELDPEQCGSFTFALSEGSDKGSATAKVELDDENDDDNIVTDKLDPSEKVIITRNKKVVLSFAADADYDLGDVKINGEKTEPTTPKNTTNNTPAKWEITLEAGKTVAVEVATTPKGSETAGTVQVDFDSEAQHLALESVKVDGEPVDKAADGTYTVDAGSTRVAIAISAEGAFKPSVSSTNDLAGEPVVTTEGTKKIYTYQFLAHKLTAETEVFKVSEEEITYAISVAGNAENVKVSASINGRALAGDVPYTVSEGEIVAITVAQKDNCTLKTVKYTVGDTEKTAKVTKGVATFTEKITGDIEITVEAAAEYKAAALTDVTDSDNPVEIQAVKNVYSVSHTGSYTVGLTQGDSTTALAVADVQIFDSKNKPVTDGVTITGQNTATPGFQLSDKVAGQKLTVKLFVAGEEELVDTKVAYTLQVTKVVSKITAPAKANQPTDTAKEYKVTTDGEIAKLTVAVQNESNPDVVVDTPKLSPDGTLTITSGQVAGTADVVVSSGEKSATIKVTTTALISKTTAKPTVTLKSASDVSLTLTLGAKKIDTPAKGAVYYKVVVTPQAETETEKMPEGAKLLKTAQTLYVPKVGESQAVRVLVGERDLLGSGGAWKYEVKVSLIHVKDAKVDITSNELTAEQIAAEIVKVDDENAESQAFETGNKPFATLTPAWESNLKLKKGTTTIYTGQQSVTIATPQFSKTTTYTEIKEANITDISYPAGGNPLTGFKVNEDGTIRVSATTNTAVGKHTIQVIAGANEKDIEGGKTNSMYASRATIAVTVVRGIDSLGVTVPSVSLYKATGKAATLKATPYYNGDTTGKNKAVAPKTKKVTWKVVKTDSDEEFDPKVTIKNGTVAVAKDYVLKPIAEDGTDPNTFRIKVSVDNGEGTKKPQWIGSATAVYSDEITITNVGAQIAAVAVVEQQQNGSFKVVAKPMAKNERGKIDPTPVEATEIKYGKVKAFTTTDIQTTYANWDALKAVIVPDTDLTFKSSKAKNVAVDRWGELTVNSPANGVKLTVTANDGSKNKAELTLNVNPDTTTSEDLALQIYKANADGTASWSDVVYKPKKGQSDTVEEEYNGSAVSRVAIQVQAWKDVENDSNGGWYEAAPMYANYTVKVKKGGKLTGQTYFNNDSQVVYNATLDKRDIEITLTNNKTKKTYTYKLTNTDILGASAAKITAKALNTLHPVGTKDEQKVTIQLGNVDLTNYADGTTVTADVEVDWSKMNDKNAGALRYFASNLSTDSYELKDIDKAKKTANIELSFKDDTPTFTQSSYALKVTLRGTTTVTGENDEEKTITSAYSQPAAVTVKVDKVKKFTFKPTTSYTIGDKDGYAVLGGKSSIPVGELNLKFTDLLNLADKNGQENHFADTFKIEGGKLMVKTDAAAADYLKDKANLTGYLEYTATTDKEYYDNKGAVKQLAKITVKVNDKAVVKYTHDSASIANKKGQTAEIQILVNSKDAMELKGVTVASALLKSTKDPIAYKEVKGGKLVLEMTEDVEIPAKGKKVSAELYIVPSDSKHVGKFVGVGVTPSEQDYKDYAATVKVTLNVTELQAEEMTVTEAETKVKAWKDEVANADPKPSWLTNSDATDATMKDAVLAAVKAYVNASDSIEITLDENETFTFKKAAVGVTGQVAGTIKISNGTADDDKTVTFDFGIPALPAPVLQYKSDIEEAVKADTIKKITCDSDGAITNESAVQTAIEQAITAIEGLSDYTVTAGNITVDKAPTKDEAGSASIVVTVTNKKNAKDTADFTITLPIPQIEEEVSG